MHELIGTQLGTLIDELGMAPTTDELLEWLHERGVHVLYAVAEQWCRKQRRQLGTYLTCGETGTFLRGEEDGRGVRPTDDSEGSGNSQSTGKSGYEASAESNSPRHSVSGEEEMGVDSEDLTLSDIDRLLSHDGPVCGRDLAACADEASLNARSSLSPQEKQSCATRTDTEPLKEASESTPDAVDDSGLANVMVKLSINAAAAGRVAGSVVAIELSVVGVVASVAQSNGGRGATKTSSSISTPKATTPEHLDGIHGPLQGKGGSGSTTTMQKDVSKADVSKADVSKADVSLATVNPSKRKASVAHLIGNGACKSAEGNKQRRNATHSEAVYDASVVHGQHSRDESEREHRAAEAVAMDADTKDDATLAHKVQVMEAAEALAADDTAYCLVKKSSVIRLKRVLEKAGIVLDNNEILEASAAAKRLRGEPVLVELSSGDERATPSGSQGSVPMSRSDLASGARIQRGEGDANRETGGVMLGDGHPGAPGGGQEGLASVGKGDSCSEGHGCGKIHCGTGSDGGVGGTGGAGGSGGDGRSNREGNGAHIGEHGLQARVDALSIETVDSQLSSFIDSVVHTIGNDNGERVRDRARFLVDRMDESQKRAAHVILVEQPALTLIEGQGGSGKSSLVELMALLMFKEIACLTPTRAAQRALTPTIVRATAVRTGKEPTWKPEVEVLTTHSGWCGGTVGQSWSSASIFKAVQSRSDKGRRNARLVYTEKQVWLLDEAAQTDFNQADVAHAVLQQMRNSRELLGGSTGVRVVAMGDPLQTPPVQETPDPRGRTHIWEGDLVQQAKAEDKMVRMTLQGMYRTADPQLLQFLTALRREDVETIVAMYPIFEATAFEPGEKVQELVHDRSEIYDIASIKYASIPGVQNYYARAEVAKQGNELSPQPFSWTSELQAEIRQTSKALLKAHLFVGVELIYQPIGKGGQARTKAFRSGRGGGWYLSRGEPLMVTSLDRLHEGVIEVRCTALTYKPYADLKEEEMMLRVEDHGWVKIWALPIAYSEITTVYSGQGSQYQNVHCHTSRFKGKRNLMYTGASRAIQKLKLSGIESEADMREKILEDPKSIIWIGTSSGLFSEDQVAAAQHEVQQMASGALHDEAED